MGPCTDLSPIHLLVGHRRSTHSQLGVLTGIPTPQSESAVGHHYHLAVRIHVEQPFQTLVYYANRLFLITVREPPRPFRQASKEEKNTTAPRTFKRTKCSRGNLGDTKLRSCETRASRRTNLHKILRSSLDLGCLQLTNCLKKEGGGGGGDLGKEA